MKKLPIYFSIDFEDFFFDTCRDIGHKCPGQRKSALDKSYVLIKNICEKYLDNKKITFFVTGILTEKYPEIIKKIHNDGHEIGCHYYFHDKIKDANRNEFISNLDKAIKIIENVTGESPLGFRAPFFAIDESNDWAYEEIAKRFKYDSSFKTPKQIEEINYFNNDIYFKNFREFYIYEHSIFFNLFKFRTGGSYLRLFSANKLKIALENTYKKGHLPLLYLHPYDITQNQEFKLSWNDLSPLTINKRIYFWLRQLQWSKLGHRTVEEKIKHIFEFFEHQGPMKDAL